MQHCFHQIKIWSLNTTWECEQCYRHLQTLVYLSVCPKIQPSTRTLSVLWVYCPIVICPSFFHSVYQCVNLNQSLVVFIVLVEKCVNNTPLLSPRGFETQFTACCQCWRCGLSRSTQQSVSGQAPRHQPAQRQPENTHGAWSPQSQPHKVQ